MYRPCDGRPIPSALSKAFVIETLMRNVEKPMADHPVLDRKSVPTGEYVYEGNVANKSLSCSASSSAMWKDDKPPESAVTNVLVRLEGMSKVERLRRVATMIKERPCAKKYQQMTLLKELDATLYRRMTPEERRRQDRPRPPP